MATEVSRLLNDIQTGEYTPTKEEAKLNESLVNSSLEQPVEQLPPTTGPGPAFDQFRLEPGRMRNESLGIEAAAAGYGQSRFDRSEFNPEANLEHKRAIEQSGFGKITNGIAKGGITALATVANTTIGTVFGLGSSLFELATDTNGNGRSFEDTVDAGTNNWISEQIIKLQNKSEEWFPNYRTEEEQSEEYQENWQRHIFTPNFIGDSILKNFGFTVGAIAGGAAWTRTLSFIMRATVASNLLKGVAASAEGNGVANAKLLEAVNKFRAGTATVADTDMLVNNINTAARQINGMRAKLALYGSVLGAMGEGSTEGLMAKDEFLEDSLAKLNQEYVSSVRDLRERITQESIGTDLVRAIPITDENGNVSFQYELNDKGEERLQQEQEKLSADYFNKRNYAEEQGKRLASTTYLLNLPILTASNVVQFGRLFSGGFKTARRVKGLQGGINIVDDTGRIAGAYESASSPVLRSLLNSAKVASTEASEEMMQGFVSSGAKNVANVNIAQYANDGYDPDITTSAQDWFANMYAGGKEYLSDWKNWQEGFLGALTGLFGIPGRFWKGEWNGGLVGAVQDARSEKRDADAAAQKLNELVNSEKFQNNWKGYVRHLKYDAEMADALEKDNAYAWHTADKNQLINDVMLFAKNGRLNDLEDLVQKYGNLSESDVENLGLKEVLVSDNKLEGNETDAQIVDKVKKKANELSTAIKQYKDLYDAITTLMPSDSDENLIDELMFTGMELKSFEERFLQKYGEVMEDIEPKLSQLVFQDSPDGESAQEKKARLENIKSAYQSIFSTLKPININPQLVAATKEALTELKNIVRGDAQLTKDVEDLEKISDARRDFYMKFNFLQNPAGAEAFKKAAITADKVSEEALKQADKQDTSGLDTIESVHQRFAETSDKSAFVNAMRSQVKDSPVLADFVSMYDTYNDFRQHLLDNYRNLVDSSTGGFGYVAEALLNDAFQSSGNEKDLINKLANSTFDKEKIYSDITNLVSEGRIPEEAAMRLVFDRMYNTALASFKSGAQEFQKAWKDTDSRKNANENVSNKPEPETSEPQGVDRPEPATESKKPQPGSTEASEPIVEAANQNEPIAGDNVEETVPDNPTEEEENEDSLETYQDNVPDEDDSYISDAKGATRLGYYQQSIPEISIFKDGTNIFANVRQWLNDLKSTNNKTYIAEVNKKIISAANNDFVGFNEQGKADKNESYAPIYKWLQDNGAFDYIATQLNTNDKLVFCTMPDCPTYNGKSQIVVGVVKSRNEEGEISEVQPLTTLSQPNFIASPQRAKYANLDELYDAIDSDYDSQSPDGSFYVFGGKSKPITSNVFAIRQGLIPYGGEPKDIRDIPFYSENAPIVRINYQGEPELLRGNPSEMSKFVYPTRSNLADGQTRNGRLYYMVKNGETYTPVALHLNNEAKDNYADVVGNIGKAIRDGLIESDVKMFRPKGVNFLFDPWNPVSGKFERMVGIAPNVTLPVYDAELGDSNEVERTAPVTEFDRIVIPGNIKLTNDIEVLDSESSAEENNIEKEYDDLPEEIKSMLKEKGITQDDWDNTSQIKRSRYLDC